MSKISLSQLIAALAHQDCAPTLVNLLDHLTRWMRLSLFINSSYSSVNIRYCGNLSYYFSNEYIDEEKSSEFQDPHVHDLVQEPNDDGF